MRTWIALAALALLLGLPAGADMAEPLLEQYHDEEQLGVVVVTEKALPDLEQVLADTKARVLILQASPLAMVEEHARTILDWVRTGRTVWFYDARMAHWFGMEDWPIQAEQFNSKPETGELGEETYDGRATTVVATGPHAVLTGVGQVTVFLPELEPGSYPAVKEAGDTVALLQFTPDSPCLAALRREGRGLVVFKPLLWTKPLSGERFQRNLLEFSAGHQVPGVAGTEKVGDPPGPQAEYVVGEPAVPPAGSSERVVATPIPPPPAEAASPEPEAAPAPAPPEPEVASSPAPAYPHTLELSAEGSLLGRITTPDLQFETAGESHHLAPEQIRSIRLRSPGAPDVLETRDGRVLTGFLMTRELEVEAEGGVRLLRKSEIVRIDFGR